MPFDNTDRYEAHGTLVGCSKCGRAVWSEHVNTTGRCVDCHGTPTVTPEAPAVIEPVETSEPESEPDADLVAAAA